MAIGLSKRKSTVDGVKREQSERFGAFQISRARSNHELVSNSFLGASGQLPIYTNVPPWLALGDF
jgi:hypothetical protein